MSMFTVYAIAAPINAFICCSFITFFMKNIKMKPSVRMIVTYVAYVLFSFVNCAGGNGLFNIDMSVFNVTNFVLYVISGFCVCLGIYFYLNRSEISRKLAAKKGKK